MVTTDDRNWELRFTDNRKRFNQSRAIAIDMESATIAANGYRMRVPYGVLLCVSDKPLHGEIKLPGAANRFYERAIGEHIRISIETMEGLAGAEVLHCTRASCVRSTSRPSGRRCENARQFTDQPDGSQETVCLSTESTHLCIDRVGKLAIISLRPADRGLGSHK